MTFVDWLLVAVASSVACGASLGFELGLRVRERAERDRAERMQEMQAA